MLLLMLLLFFICMSGCLLLLFVWSDVGDTAKHYITSHRPGRFRASPRRVKHIVSYTYSYLRVLRGASPLKANNVLHCVDSSDVKEPSVAASSIDTVLTLHDTTTEERQVATHVVRALAEKKELDDLKTHQFQEMARSVTPLFIWFNDDRLIIGCRSIENMF